MKPELIELRKRNTEAAIIFIHDFSGQADKTWGLFPCFILQSKTHENWDVFSLGFPTNFLPDIRGVWSSNPGLEILSKSLLTKIKTTVLSEYKSIAFIAHSMGGLIAQRTLVEMNKINKELYNKISHIFLFGTPSNGLKKASILWFYKQQFKDMGHRSNFIKQLRTEWEKLKLSSLFFRTIDGISDQFVPPVTSLQPFPDEFHHSVPGDHISMIKPLELSNDSVQIVLYGLHNEDKTNILDSARAAVKERDFHNIIAKWEPFLEELSNENIIQLALAYDGINKREKAIKLLEKIVDNSTDAMGTLAGRYKRIWLENKARQNAAKQAFELYSKAFRIAKEENDLEQSFYNGINVAFMELGFKNEHEKAKQTAKEVLYYCKKIKKEDKGKFTAIGEAYLIKGNQRLALQNYRNALDSKLNANISEITSMYQQAIRILKFLNDKELAIKLDKLFRKEIR